MATLFKRKGIWYVNFTLNGKQHRKSTRTSNRKLAGIALKDLELKLFKEALTEKHEIEPVLVRDLFRRYLSHVDENCAAGYTDHVRWHLRVWQDYLTRIGIGFPGEISLKSVDDFFDSELSGRAPKTKKEYLTTLKACLNRAVEWGLLDKNPVASARPPRRIARKVNFYSESEVAQLIEQAPVDLEVAITLLVNTGMRLGELWALRWKDVDFKNQQLWVRSYNGFTPKGKRDRCIPLNEVAFSVIQNLRQSRNKKDEYVYRLTRSYKRLSNKFIRYSKKIGLQGRLHDLRHSFASHLVMSGIPLPAVQELLGHRQITTTMIYAHLAPSAHKRAVNRLPFVAQRKHTGVKGLQCNALSQLKSSHPDFVLKRTAARWISFL